MIRYNRSGFVQQRINAMELKALWHLFKRRWWLIALPALVALIVTLPTLKNVVSPPVSYRVQMRLTAAAPPDVEFEGGTTPYEDSVYVPLLASEYVVVNMPHWIASDSFADEVSAVLDERGANIEDALEGAFVADSFRSILTLYVVWDDPNEIRMIAASAITVLQTRNQVYFPQFAAEPVQVVPLDEVEVSEVAPPITTRIAPLIRILVGLATGVGLAILAEYLDDSLRSRADVEALGLSVLAEIPPER
jgi:capsular polysaccharide biosynthesis protein